MDHEKLKDKLFALYDGELTGPGREEIERHLADCRECRQIYAQWQRTAKVLFRPSDIVPSEGFVRRVMARIEALEQPQAAPSWRANLRWFAPALGAAALLLFAMGSMQQTVSVEALLLEDGRDNISTEVVLACEPPTTDQIFDFIMEG